MSLTKVSDNLYKLEAKGVPPRVEGQEERDFEEDCSLKIILSTDSTSQREIWSISYSYAVPPKNPNQQPNRRPGKSNVSRPSQRDAAKSGDTVPLGYAIVNALSDSGQMLAQALGIPLLGHFFVILLFLLFANMILSS